MPDELGWSDEEIEDLGKGYVEWRNGPDKEKIDAALEAARKRDARLPGVSPEQAAKNRAEAGADQDRRRERAERIAYWRGEQERLRRRRKKPTDRKSGGK